MIRAGTLNLTEFREIIKFHNSIYAMHPMHPMHITPIKAIISGLIEYCAERYLKSTGHMTWNVTSAWPPSNKGPPGRTERNDEANGRQCCRMVSYEKISTPSPAMHMSYSQA
jgi:hypothetical protein